MAKEAPAGALTRRDESLTATVAAVRFSSDGADRWLVVTFLDGTTGVGNVRPDLPIESGTKYLFSGRWQTHEKYGLQFRWNAYVLPAPADEAGVVAYLKRYVDGIGERRSARLWELYGADAVKTLREQPLTVAAAGVMPADEAEVAAETLRGIAGYEETYIALLGIFDGRGWPLNRIIAALIARWRVRAPEIVRRNPFAMMVARMAGAGFVRCDSLFLAFGLPRRRLKRQMLCIWNALATDGTGSTWLPEDVARRELARTVVGGDADPEQALSLGLRSRWIARRTDEHGRVFLAAADRAGSEQTVADRVTMLLGGPR